MFVLEKNIPFDYFFINYITLNTKIPKIKNIKKSLSVKIISNVHIGFFFYIKDDLILVVGNIFHREIWLDLT